ncbi:hypothetical protein [Acinetobacter terrae]
MCTDKAVHPANVMVLLKWLNVLSGFGCNTFKWL